MNRKERRNQAKRAIQRARRRLRIFEAGWDGEIELSTCEATVRLYAKNRKPCSCYMCRNEKYRNHRAKNKKIDYEVQNPNRETRQSY